MRSDERAALWALDTELFSKTKHIDCRSASIRSSMDVVGQVEQACRQIATLALADTRSHIKWGIQHADHSCQANVITSC